MKIRERKIKEMKRRRRNKIRVAIGVAVMLVLIAILFACSLSDDKSKEKTEESASKETSVEVKIKEEPEAYVEPEIDIIMVGDVLLHDNVQESGKLSDGTYNYDHLFTNIKEYIQAVDIAIANQEVILGGKEIGLYGYPNFNGAYEVGDALVNAGFNVVLHATNHTLDRGKTALENCMNYWKTTH